MGVAQGRVEGERAGAVLEQPARRLLVLGEREADLRRLEGPEALLGRADAPTAAEEQCGRSHQGEPPRLLQPGLVDSRALEELAAEGRLQAIQGHGQDARLGAVHLELGEVAVLGGQLGLLDGSLVARELCDVQPRLEALEVLGQQVRQVGALVVAGLELGTEVAEVEAARVEGPRGRLVLGADAGQLALELSETLSQGDLLGGELLPDAVELGDAGLEACLERLLGRREGRAGPVGRILALAESQGREEEGGERGGLHGAGAVHGIGSSSHWMVMGRRTKLAGASLFMIRMASAISAAASFCGVHSKPSAVEVPRPAAVPSLLT